MPNPSFSCVDINEEAIAAIKRVIFLDRGSDRGDRGGDRAIRGAIAAIGGAIEISAR